MENRKVNKFLALLVIPLGTAMFYFNDGGVSLGPYTVMTKLILAFVIFLFGLWAFLVKPDMERTKWIARDAFVMALPYLLMILVSMVIWIMKNSPFSHITRGLSFSLYQIVGMMAAIGYLWLFGRKGIFVMLTSMFAANSILVVNSIRTFGVSAFFRDYAALVKSFGAVTGGAVIELEIHDLTFAMGIYLLYFLLYQGKIKGRWLLILITAFFFTLGLKRIAVMALAVALLLTWLNRAGSERSGKVGIQIFSAFFIILAIGYIAMIKFGLFTIVTDMLNIDTKGRTSINDFIDAYYSFSPLFEGYGLGYVSRLLLSGAAGLFSTARALHNDFLRMYIEMGFWGYIVWLWLSWKTKISYFCNRRNLKIAMMAFALFTYCFITYLTDNTYYYFYINMVTFVLVLSCEYDREPEEQEAVSEEEKDRDLYDWKKTEYGK